MKEVQKWWSKTMILFRFHNNFDICCNRIEMAKRLNPKEPIVGIYGGKYGGLTREGGNPVYQSLSGIYEISNGDGRWKWKHFDVALCQWFREIGKNLPWTRLNIMEWDLLFIRPNTQVYSNLDTDDVGVTQITEESNLDPKWGWITGKRKQSWILMKTLLRSRFNYEGPYYGSVGPGLSLPRDFLSEYSKIPDDVILNDCNDEARIPNFAKAMGFPIKPNKNISPTEVNQDDTSIFNCKQQEVDTETVMKEFFKKEGRIAFHPFKGRFNLYQGVS